MSEEDEAVPQPVLGVHPQPPASCSHPVQIATILAEGLRALVCANRGLIHYSGHHWLPHQV